MSIWWGCIDTCYPPRRGLHNNFCFLYIRCWKLEKLCFVLLLHTWLSQLLLIIYRGMITLVLTLKAKKKGKSPFLKEVLTILWCKLQFVYGNYKQLKSGSKSTAWRCFLHFTNRPRLSINASICYVSTVPFRSYAWSFMNDAESCRTRKNNDMVRQEV